MNQRRHKFSSCETYGYPSGYLFVDFNIEIHKKNLQLERINFARASQEFQVIRFAVLKKISSNEAETRVGTQHNPPNQALIYELYLTCFLFFSEKQNLKKIETIEIQSQKHYFSKYDVIKSNTISVERTKQPKKVLLNFHFSQIKILVLLI